MVRSTVRDVEDEASMWIVKYQSAFTDVPLPHMPKARCTNGPPPPHRAHAYALAHPSSPALSDPRHLLLRQPRRLRVPHGPDHVGVRDHDRAETLGNIMM